MSLPILMLLIACAVAKIAYDISQAIFSSL